MRKGEKIELWSSDTPAVYFLKELSKLGLF